MKRAYATAIMAFLTFLSGTFLAFSDENSSRGQRVFSACAACHSLQPNQNMTGPSLADLWGRKAV
jgi:cytochrome c